MRGLREGLEGGVGLALDLIRQRRVLDMRERGLGVLEARELLENLGTFCGEKEDGDGEEGGVVCLFRLEKFKNNRLIIIIIILFLFMFVLKQVHFPLFW